VNENAPHALLHVSSHSPATGPSGAAEQKGDLRSLVSCQRGNSSRSRSRSQTPRCRDGFFSVLHTWNQSSGFIPCPLRGARRSLSLDHTRWVRSPDNYFLPKAYCVRFSWQVRRGPPAGLPEWGAPLPENLKLLSEPKIFAAWLRHCFDKTGWST